MSDPFRLATLLGQLLGSFLGACLVGLVVMALAGLAGRVFKSKPKGAPMAAILLGYFGLAALLRGDLLVTWGAALAMLVFLRKARS